jgi:hypothetical protein
VDKLWEDKRREREEAEAGYSTKTKNPTQRCGEKQKPHTSMWGKNRCSGTTRTLDLVFAQAQPEQDDIASSMKIDTQAQPEQDDSNSKIYAQAQAEQENSSLNIEK